MRSRLTRFDGLAVVGWVTTVALLLLVVYPLGSTVVRSFVSGGSLDLRPMVKVLSDGAFYTSLRNSFVILLFSVPAALAVGSLFAWLNERTDAGFGALSRLLPLVPLLIPAIALSVGWVLLAQKSAGFLNGLLRAILERVRIVLTTGPIDVGTWPWLLFVYTIMLVPYSYLVVSAALRDMDTSLDEASRMSGASPWRTAIDVSLPAIRPALASASLLMTIVGISIFSVPRTIGSLARIDTVSVYIVRLTQAFPSRLDEAVAVSLILLLFVSAVWVLQRRVSGVGRHATIGGRASSPTIVRLGPWRWLARTVMALYIASVSVLPFAALAIVSVQPFWQPRIDVGSLTLGNLDEFFFLPDSGPRTALYHSLELGFAGATIAMLIAAVLVSHASDSGGATARVIEGTTKAPGAISHLVLGVGVLVAFSGWPFYLGGTLALLLLGYLVVYIPQASIAAETARRLVGSELLEASYVFGGSRLHTARAILWPLMRSGLAAGWALSFVVIVGDLTASTILAGPGSDVVGSIFLQIWEAGRFATMATLGMVICVTTGTVVAIVLALTGGRRRRRVEVSGVPVSEVSVGLP